MTHLQVNIMNCCYKPNVPSHFQEKLVRCPAGIKCVNHCSIVTVNDQQSAVQSLLPKIEWTRTLTISRWKMLQWTGISLNRPNGIVSCKKWKKISFIDSRPRILLRTHAQTHRRTANKEHLITAINGRIWTKRFYKYWSRYKLICSPV